TLPKYVSKMIKLKLKTSQVFETCEVWIKFAPSMQKKFATSLYSQSPKVRKLRDTIANFQNSSIETSESLDQNISVSGLIGSSLSMVLAETFRHESTSAELPFLLILN